MTGTSQAAPFTAAPDVVVKASTPTYNSLPESQSTLHPVPSAVLAAPGLELPLMAAT